MVIFQIFYKKGLCFLNCCKTIIKNVALECDNVLEQLSGIMHGHVGTLTSLHFSHIGTAVQAL